MEVAKREGVGVEPVGGDPHAVLEAAEPALAQPAPETHAESGLVPGEIEQEKAPLSVPGTTPTGCWVETSQGGGAAFRSEGNAGVAAGAPAFGEAGTAEGAELGTEPVTGIPSFQDGPELMGRGMRDPVEEGDDQFGEIEGGGVRVHLGSHL